MKATIEDVKSIVSVLTAEQQQLLKDTIKYGLWGDGTEGFLNEEGEVVDDGMMGYCTNDAKEAGHFSGRKIAAMFRAIYKKMCPTGFGQVISHTSDWWGDGTGDMLFIRYNYYKAFEEWAREKDVEGHGFKIVGINPEGRTQNVIEPTSKDKATKAWKTFISSYVSNGCDIVMNGDNEFNYIGITFKLVEC